MPASKSCPSKPCTFSDSQSATCRLRKALFSQHFLELHSNSLFIQLLRSHFPGRPPPKSRFHSNPSAIIRHPPFADSFNSSDSWSPPLLASSTHSRSPCPFRSFAIWSSPLITSARAPRIQFALLPFASFCSFPPFRRFLLFIMSRSLPSEVNLPTLKTTRLRTFKC